MTHSNIIRPGRRWDYAALSAATRMSLLCLSCVACLARADTPAGLLLAVNEGESTLGIIDPRSGKQVAKISEGGDAGHEVASSFDGRTAYVPIYGNSSLGEPGTDGRALAAIDIASRKVIGRLDFGHGVRPHAPLLNPRDGMLYVTTEIDRTVTVIDPKGLKIVATIPTGQAQSHMLVLSHDGRFGYTANVDPGTVSVLDLSARVLLALIPVSTKIQRIAISTDDSLVFTADQTKPQVAVIDTATRQLRSWISIPAPGYGMTPTPDGRTLLVAMQSLSQVAVIDLKIMRVVRVIDLPKSPHEILVSPDGATAYVSCSARGVVASVRIADWSVTGLIDAGHYVDGLAWTTARY